MPATVATVRTVDLLDEQDLRAWHAFEQGVHHQERPDAPFWSAEDVVAVVRPDDPEERFYPFVAEEDGVVVGAGIVFVPVLDNLDKAHVKLVVDPAHRGRGIGDRLMAHALDVARAEGRPVVIGEAYLPADHDETHPVRRFAARHGFALANQEVRRTLHLPVADETIQGWVDEAAPFHEGYEITTYDGLVPEHLQESLVDLLNQLAVDAPTGDIEFEAGGTTVETYRHQIERSLAAGRRIYETVAVKGGVVVAQSTLSVPPPGEAMPHLNQWGTYVHRDHRGHRLGLAVKAANLRHVQALHPERTVISTTNSPANAPMVAINERMGFRPVEVLAEFLRRL